MGKGKLTDTQRDYNKAYKNVINRIEKMKSQGYEFSDKQIPKKLVRPQKKSIENLKSLTKKELASQKQTKFTYKDEEGNEKTVSGAEGLKFQQSEASKKGWEKRKKHDGAPPIPLGVILLNRLLDVPNHVLRGSGKSKASQDQEQRINQYFEAIREQESSDYKAFIKHLEYLNDNELFDEAQQAVEYYPLDECSEGWRHLTIFEGLIRGRALTLEELTNRQQGEEDGWEYADDSEPLPFF